MRILFVAAEASPLAKAGGMGVVTGSLSKVLRAMGHDVRIFLPYYGSLPKTLEVSSCPVWDGAAMFEQFSVYETVLPETDVPLYLLQHPCFDGPHIYGLDNDDWRFTFFANGAAEFCWNHWKPQIIHCHDWHTGMIPVWMHQSPDISTVFTIHNLAYQGPSRARLEQITWCPWYMEGHNTMAAALRYADRVTTVSPTYAEQIKTPAYGENLEELLTSIGDKVLGIINGIDPTSYDPSVDASLPQTYTSTELDHRKINKASLQKELGLQERPQAWLVSMVTRLVEQKGIDLVLQVLDRFLAYTDSQFVLLGTGDRYYETQLWQLAARYSGRMSVQLLYDDALSRRIYAGSDVALMPSRFEPCGISQLIAMRYGCVPIVRRTGGLVDTVAHYNPRHQTGTGYCFDRYEPLDLYTCLVRAWEGYHYEDSWQALQTRAMETDVSWEQSSLAYNRLYNSVSNLPLESIPQKHQATTSAKATLE
ncbi:MAG: glycogen synthase GlgA [Cyanobacteria bacterium P01_A01_bin.17]